MPSSLIFQGGGEVKVTADIADVERFIAAGAPAQFQRFAGYRGEDPVAAETLVVRPDALACAQALLQP